ncbi:hydantoinase/oxoprolinase family protein [Thermodesulfobacterium hydrogeniphilum]|uniref:hydantoinase/oxoprolinase family protein n=1 Tax=Thermodesulfobacterium hydrogeniphilum TaxID=161156 RepID=UPI00056FE41E|nr:hydantoinase/oxoprolinase family protein [Thermodesulfobacterium hydrogeniphilum]
MRVAIDTGGTFTDIVYLENNILKSDKVFSTPSDPSLAILEGISRIDPSLKIETLIHGSTVGTNAFLERKGAKIAFITTSGFEDIIFIGRQNRPSLYDFFVEKPAPIVSQENCFGIEERINAKGEILKPLKDSEIQRCLNWLKEKDIKSVAVCLLHSYLYPEHEIRLKKAFLSLNLPISISSEILPEFREYERASTTAINAYLSPVMGRYLNRLKKKLSNIKIYIQQSNGGWLTAEEASRFACHTILSGPAGGVAGAYIWAKNLEENKIITFDMGGTSTDVCLVDDKIPFTKEYMIDGYPLSIPVIDIHTVGAGGGSIAYIDTGGALKVGPESAGADPGPACYGKGNKPTVTDANLILGRILPEAFLGGRFSLQKERSEKAIFELAKKLNLGLEETALGIIQVANINMCRALRKVSLERGYDPQEFALFCFGGAGGLHASTLAKELGIKKVIIPKLAGSFSAFGLLVSPPIKDFSRTIWIKAEKKKKLHDFIKILTAEAQSYIKNIGFDPQDFDTEIFLDMRYKGQGFELTIPFTENYIDLFEKEHLKQFGYLSKDFPVEVITLRVRIRGKYAENSWKIEKGEEKYHLKQTKVFTEKGFIEVPVIDWNSLKIGDSFKGPAIILENFTTVWVEPEFIVKVKENYTLVLEIL